MQTFLPSKSFEESASILDSKRLNKQILECYQILKVLSSDDPKAGWRNHPAVKMWRGAENVLYKYATAMIQEANRRGIRTAKNQENLKILRRSKKQGWGSQYPKWLQNSEERRRVITTHRANLYRKDPEYYYPFEVEMLSEYNKPCCDRCQYYWTTHAEAVANG
jgi:hypothetical protein